MRRRAFVQGLATAGAGLALPASLAGRAAARPAPAAASWREVPAPAGTPAARLYGVAAAGPGLAWAVGQEDIDNTKRGAAVARHWDGTAWLPTDLSHLTYTTLRAVAVSPSGGAAWAVGTDAAGHDQLLAWDGTTWRETSFPGRGEAGTRLTDVAAAPDGRFWVSGRHGDRAGLLRGDGKTWRWCRPLPDEAAPTPDGVHVTPGGEVWVFGDVIARYDGAWTVIPRLLGIRASVSGLLPVAHDDIWLTGWAYGIGGPPGKPPGVRLEHWDGTQWNGVKGPFGVGMLTSIVGDADGKPDRISGWDFWDDKRAHYLRWDGTAWASERGPQSNSTVLPVALARIPGTDGGLWSVGTTSFYPNPPAQIRVERFG